MIAHYYSAPDAGALCGSTGGEGHYDLEHVTCPRCIELATAPPTPMTAAEVIHQVAELDGKPPTDDTAGEPDDAEHVASELEEQARDFPFRKPLADAMHFAGQSSRPAPMEPITSTVTHHDPAHHTERSLRAAASWQVLCQTRLELDALAMQTFFHGAHPLGEVTRFAQDMHKSMVKHAYAYGMHQCDMEWLVAGVDTTDNYDEHFVRMWGRDFTDKLRAWWLGLYEAAHVKAVEDHLERQRLSAFEPAPHG